MQVVIKISERIYKKLAVEKEENIPWDYVEKMIAAITYGIPLPKDATNGDVFMTMFPNLIWHSVRGDLIGKTSVDMPIGNRWQKNMFYCDTNWWEAPYTREESKDAHSH